MKPAAIKRIVSMFSFLFMKNSFKSTNATYKHLKLHEPGNKQTACINDQDAHRQYYSHFFSFHVTCIAKEMPEKEADVIYC